MIPRDVPTFGLGPRAVAGIREAKAAPPRTPAGPPRATEPPPPLPWRTLKRIADLTGRDTRWREAAARQGRRDVLIDDGDGPAILRVAPPIW